MGGFIEIWRTVSPIGVISSDEAHGTLARTYRSGGQVLENRMLVYTTFS